MFTMFELMDSLSYKFSKFAPPPFSQTNMGLWGWFSVVTFNSLGIFWKPFHGFTFEMPKGERSNVDFAMVRLQGMVRHQCVVRPGIVRQGSVKQQGIVVRQQGICVRQQDFHGNVSTVFNKVVGRSCPSGCAATGPALAIICRTFPG